MPSSAFQRRHYTEAAGWLSRCAGAIIRAEITTADEAWRYLREEMIASFEIDNERFDRSRFNQAVVPTRPWPGDDDAA